jgi:DNA polymerase
MAMGALKMGLTEKELPALVTAWRNSNRNIVKLWSQVEVAAFKAVKNQILIKLQYGLQFYCDNGILFIRLPSGRKLAYVSPRIEEDPKLNRPILTYEGMDQSTKQWSRINTYGGKLVENIVQAIARDCLAVAMLRLQEAGYKIVMHIHDEVVLDVPRNYGSLKEVEDLMGLPIDWAKGLILRAEGFEGEFYKKN